MEIAKLQSILLKIKKSITPFFVFFLLLYIRELKLLLLKVKIKNIHYFYNSLLYLFPYFILLYKIMKIIQINSN